MRRRAVQHFRHQTFITPVPSHLATRTERAEKAGFRGRVATDDTPPSGAAADWTIPQGWESYMLGEHTLWNQLFVGQPSCISTQWSRQLSQRGGLKPASQQAAQSQPSRIEIATILL